MSNNHRKFDRRQQKTRQAIFSAFSQLLENKHFNNITVQEIIDKANVGRSTFYSHFDTKDHLLKEMCHDIFDHVFSDELIEENSHDFSAKPVNLENLISHLLYHLQDNYQELNGLLNGSSSNLFLTFFNEYLAQMFSPYAKSNCASVPEDFALNYLVGSFSETVRWWFKGKMKMSPEELSSYYVAMTRIEG